MVFRFNEEDDILEESLQIFNKISVERMKEFHNHLTVNEIVKISASGLNPQELVNIAFTKMGEEVDPIRPLAIKLEAGGEKELLTINLED